MSPFARLTLGVVVIAVSLGLLVPYVCLFVRVAFVPLLVLLLFLYAGRLIWWYTRS